MNTETRMLWEKLAFGNGQIGDRLRQIPEKDLLQRLDRLMWALEDRILFDATMEISGLGSEALGELIEVQPAQDVATEFAESTEVIFVDKSVAGYQQLVAELVSDRNAEVHFLSTSSDGWAQISRVLEGRSNLTAIHLVSHGSDGQIQLGSTAINAAAIRNDAAADHLSVIRNALSEDGDILLYGCRIAESERGAELLSSLAEGTGADIAASSNLTGGSDGADWFLEHVVGQIDVQALAATNWTGTLDLTVTTAGALGVSAATDMAQMMLGSGITVNSAVYFGDGDQSGNFTTGVGVSFGANILTFEDGTIFSTGTAVSVGGPNSSGSTSVDAGGVDGDPDFDALTGFSTFDGAFLEIVFTPDVPAGANVGDVGRMTMEIVFGSEEYNEYVYSNVNDTLAVIVNGVNRPVVPSGLAIGIDTINQAGIYSPANGSDANDPNPGHDTTDGVLQSANPNLYINNDDGSFNTQMDGFTITLPVTFDVVIGQQNTMKVGIADASDSAWDSWMFVKADSGQTVIVAEGDVLSTPINVAANIDVTANDYDLQNDPLSIVRINDVIVSPGVEVTLPTGVSVTLNPDGTLTVVGFGNDPFQDTFTYQITDGNGGTSTAIVVVDFTAPVLPPELDLDLSDNPPSVVTSQDDFESGGLSGGSGWDTNWTFVSLGGGGNAADVDVEAFGGTNALFIQDDNVGVQRTVNLAGAMEATLTFDYRRDGLDVEADYVSLLLSDDNGANFVEVARFAGPGSDASYIPVSYDISPYISSATVIRFASSTTLGNNDELYIDNVAISSRSWPTGFATNYVTNTPAVGVTSLQATATDVDSTFLSGATITNTNAEAGDALVLLGALPGGISGTVSADKTVVTLAGDASLADYETALETIGFESISHMTGERSIQVQVFDERGAGSNVATSIITVDVDSDGDGVANTLDVDDDNDGLLDTSEAGSLWADWDETTSGSATIVGTIDGIGVLVTNNSNIRNPNISSSTPGFVGNQGLYPTGAAFGNQEVLNLADGNGATYDFQFDSALPTDIHVHFTALDGSVNLTGATIISTINGTGTGSELFTFQNDGALTNEGGFTAVISAGATSFQFQHALGGDNYMVTFTTSALDSDSDGIADMLDIDSDQDGITDNIEAQSTSQYIAPSGSIASNGLDEVYDQSTALGIAAGMVGVGLVAVNTDGGDEPDYLDTDSDNDGTLDIQERFDGQSTSIVSSLDQDVDGLLDEFEGSDALDGYDVNDENYLNGTGFTLGAVPGVNADGSNAIPLITDLFFRDVNDSPTATNDSPTTNEDTPVTFNPLANDTDVDGTLDGSTVIFINPPAGATLSPDGKTLTVPGEGIFTVLPTGQITFSPAANFAGTTTSVTYQVADNDGATVSANIMVGVGDINDAPVVNTALNNQSNLDGETVSWNVASHFNDIDGDTLVYSAIGLPLGLTIDSSTGEISGQLTSNASQFGPYAVSVQASDPDGLSATSSFEWTVDNVAPQAVDDMGATSEDQSYTGNVLTEGVDVDVDGDTLVVIALEGNANALDMPIRLPSDFHQSAGRCHSIARRQDADRSRRWRLHRAADRRNHVQPGGEFCRYDDVGDVPSGGQRRRQLLRLLLFR
ncbi:MAG: DUF4347 domain-containing protein [Pirellulaceae bacterium]